MRRLLAASILLAAVAAACSSDVTPTTGTLNPASTVTPFLLAPETANSEQSAVVYVSLSPDSIPGATSVTIQAPHSGASVTAAMTGGGFDPVAIPAQSGDTLQLSVQRPQGPVSFVVVVPKPHPPRVVRTDPPANKRDVPLNASLAIVFSQPIDPGSLTASTVRVSVNNVPVTGTLVFTNVTHTAAEFTPGGNLAPNTTYQITVTDGVQDTDGRPLDAPITVPFTTGNAVAPTGTAAISLSSVSLAIPVGGSVLLTATVKDSGGKVIPGAPVVWSSTNASAATVSSAGLIQGVSVGPSTIMATVGAFSASAELFVVAAPSNPSVAKVILGTPSISIALGGSVQLSAVAEDSHGTIITAPIVYSSNAPNIATVSVTGNAVGMSPGTAVITATSEGVAGTMTITVSQPTSGPELKFASVSAGQNSTCALTTDGAAYCWGEHVPGPGAYRNSSVPLAVSAALRFSAISSGAFDDACGVSLAGALYCWSAANSSQLLVGQQIKSVSVGAFHSCALTVAGAAYCWGEGLKGELGVDSASLPSTCPIPDTPVVQAICNVPARVSGGLLFRTINADDGQNSCGITTAGSAYCWGDNLFGGDGTGSNVGPQPCVGDEYDLGPIEPLVYPCSSVPVAVSGGLTFADVQNGCGLTLGGQLACWGSNFGGLLGIGSATGPETCSYVSPSGPGSQPCSTTPVVIAGGISFIQVTGRSSRRCALASTGAAYCWGAWSTSSDFPGGPTRMAPAPDAQGVVFTSLSASGDHACGITAAGAIYCWGANAYGQLGNGTTTSTTTPVKVITVSP